MIKTLILQLELVTDALYKSTVDIDIDIDIDITSGNRRIIR